MPEKAKVNLGDLRPGKLFSMENQTALLIGAGGLGSVSALGLAAAGARLAVADIDAARAASVANSIRRENGEAESFAVDVTELASVQGLMDSVVQRFGRVHAAVITAAVTHLCPPESFPEREWDRVLETNLKGTFLCCQAVGRHMLEQGGGAIVNFSSIAGLAGLKRTPAYCASKGGVSQLTRALAFEWADRGVRVNAVAPSWFETDLVRGAVTPETAALHAERISRVPMKRQGRPEELVGAVVFLASPASAMVTGVILPIDGGYLAY